MILVARTANSLFQVAMMEMVALHQIDVMAKEIAPRVTSVHLPQNAWRLLAHQVHQCCMFLLNNPAVGECEHIPVTDGTSCGTGNLCENRCEAGLCSTTPVACPQDPNPLDCLMYQCQPGNGSCVLVHRPDNSPCSDGNSCTLNDVCMAGVCVGTPRVCTTDNECEVAYCSLGSCTTLGLSEKPCDFDGNNCTDDYCSNGQCIQGAFKSCTHLDSLDKCTVGVCNKESGECFAEAKDGTLCSDGDPCTYQDQCIVGVCIGVPDPDKQNLVLCGGEPSEDPTAPIAIAFAAAGAAALIGLIIGVAFLVKRVKNSRYNSFVQLVLTLQADGP